MDELINTTLKKIVASEDLLKKLLLIDNVDDLYKFFISQGGEYSKIDLIKYFIQIAMDNVISEEDLNKVSGGATSKNFSKALCAALSALTLASVPVSTYNVSAYTSVSSKSAKSNLNFSSSVKDKIVQKVQQIKETIKKYPITSTATMGTLVFCGLYKKIIAPQFEELRDALNRYNNMFQQSREDIVTTMRNLTALSEYIRTQVVRLGNADNELNLRLNNLVGDITNLQNQIARNNTQNTEVQRNIQNINNQIQDILQRLNENIFRFLPRQSAAPNYANVLALQVQPKCELGDARGRTYVANYVSNLEVNVSDRNTMILQLEELCHRFGYTQGIATERGDRTDDWHYSPTQYFFTGAESKYPQMGSYHKRIFAQCIKAMYQNMDNPLWRDIIEEILLSFCTHGGHCSWRAVALTNAAYSALCHFLKENRIGVDGQIGGGGNDELNLTDKVFTDLKDQMVQTARDMFLQAHGVQAEPLLDCNNMEDQLRFFLGMVDNENRRGDRNAREYLSQFMDKKYLIRQSNQIIHDSLEEGARGGWLENIGRCFVSFENYCKYSGKTRDEIQLLTDAVEAYPDGNFKDLLREWIQGNITLSLNGEQGTVSGVVTPIRKNVQVGSLTEIEGENNRYYYVDSEGQRHTCKIIRTIGQTVQRQIEYVDEFNQENTQCNIFSMLDILSTKARRERNLATNDGSLIGCPELGHFDGFKFIVACFEDGYFQEIY